MNRNEMLCVVVALLSGAAVLVSSNLSPHKDSPEEVRVRAFRQCMNTMGTTEAVCKEVIGEAESNHSRP